MDFIEQLQYETVMDYIETATNFIIQTLEI